MSQNKGKADIESFRSSPSIIYVTSTVVVGLGLRPKYSEFIVRADASF